jgi:adenosylcobinamide kinase/adenosylcobinamide-phosphate guanylyltransferase
MRELIVGGIRSGKSAAALARARRWLQEPGHDATLVATAIAGDAALAARIARHRAERARLVPQLATIEEAHALPEALDRLCARSRLVLVDCLTLWAANALAPLDGPPLHDAAWQARAQALAQAVRNAAGPVVLVSNEIGLGIIGADAATRRFADALGELNQRVAAACTRVTLCVAGCELRLKEDAC